MERISLVAKELSRIWWQKGRTAHFVDVKVVAETKKKKKMGKKQKKWGEGSRVSFQLRRRQLQRKIVNLTEPGAGL